MDELYGSVLNLVQLITYTIFIYFPAMAANGAPVFIAKGTPIDMGKVFIDNKRVFGDGKTIEGFFIGILFGTSIGAIYSIYSSNMWFIPYAFTLSIGALIGDMLGAFIKRRIGIERGKPAPILDQTSFLVIATVLVKVIKLDILVGVYIGLTHYLTGIMISILLHISTNYGAYRLGLKEVPW